ncbi:MAG: MBL fold metallo-hydrolase [Acidobacteria bacterium]|nr:MBL fold metallo-hydrolase [Acidobacteriota bacterium]
MREATTDTSTQTIDVEYLGMTRYIACCLLEGDGPAIIDPGPTVSLGKLEEGLWRAGLSIDDLGSVLLTHIHLDHAGAAGTIVKRNPRIKVYVHEKGASHMIDPERLLASAEHLYGDQMDVLWGDFLAVPKDNVRALSGGEALEVAGRQLQVAYTPGHAVHHVSYLDTSTGTAYVGDTAGIRIANDPFVLPVTPPPDIDLELWESSLQKIEAWRPERLFVTHFGQADGVEGHLDRFRGHLHDWATAVRRGVESDASDEQCVEEFTASVESRLNESVSADKVPLYLQGGAPSMSWHGLARYWRRTLEAT